MDFQTWESVAKIGAIFAGVIFGSVAISAACMVWVQKQIFAYGGSTLCIAGVVLLGLSIWHSVEFGVGPTGLSFKAAHDMVASAASSAEVSAKASVAAEQAAKEAASVLLSPDSGNAAKAKKPAEVAKADAARLAEAARVAQAEKAAEDARRASEEAQKHLQEVTKSLGSVFGHRVCIPWC